MATWWIRPTGQVYGSANGTSYANAWAGIGNVNWGAINVSTDELMIAGTHTQGIRIQNQINGSISRLFPVRGDYSTDPGIIDCRYTLPGWNTPANWTEETTGLWYMSGVTNSPYTEPGTENTTFGRMFFNGIEVLAALSKAKITTTLSWWHDVTNSRLYVLSNTGNPATVFSSITSLYHPNNYLAGYQATSFPFFIDKADYLDIYGLTFRGGIKNSVQLSGLRYSVVRNNSIGAYTAGCGILCLPNMDSGEVSFSYNTIKDNTIDTVRISKNNDITEGFYGGGDGVKLALSASNNEVFNNDICDFGHNHIEVLGNTIAGVYSGVNGNKIYKNSLHNRYSEYCRAVGIQGIEGECNNNEFYQNNCFNLNVRSQVGGAGTKVHSNRFADIRHHQLSNRTEAGQGIALQPYGYGFVCHDVIIANNDFVNIDGAGLVFIEGVPVNSSSHIHHCKVYNNRFVENGLRRVTTQTAEVNYTDTNKCIYIGQGALSQMNNNEISNNICCNLKNSDTIGVGVSNYTVDNFASFSTNTVSSNYSIDLPSRKGKVWWSTQPIGINNVTYPMSVCDIGANQSGLINPIHSSASITGFNNVYK